MNYTSTTPSLTFYAKCNITVLVNMFHRIIKLNFHSCSTTISLDSINSIINSESCRHNCQLFYDLSLQAVKHFSCNFVKVKNLVLRKLCSTISILRQSYSAWNIISTMAFDMVRPPSLSKNELNSFWKKKKSATKWFYLWCSAFLLFELHLWSQPIEFKLFQQKSENFLQLRKVYSLWHWWFKVVPQWMPYFIRRLKLRFCICRKPGWKLATP